MTDDLPDLRASDADRERVAEVLRDAMAEGRLDMDEFEERLEATYKARTYGELTPITADLPTAGASVSLVEPAADGVAGGRTHWPSRIGGRPTSKGAFAFWSGFNRKGRWTAPNVFTAFAMWGGGEIDLREAGFESGEVVLRLFTIMGGMHVVVPPDLTVRVTGFGIMGGFGDDATGEGTPGSPTVTVTGFALMGGIGVERKLRRAERQRLKEERRAERLEGRDAGRAALGDRHGEPDDRHDRMRKQIENPREALRDRHDERHEARHERREARRADRGRRRDERD